MIAAVAVTYLASPLAADEVVTRRDNFGPDMAFVEEFLSLNWPEYYRPGDGDRRCPRDHAR